MIKYRLSRQAIFRALLFSIIITCSCFSGFAVGLNRDVEARKKLVKKYEDDDLIRSRLEIILLTGPGDRSSQEVNRFLEAPYDIGRQKGAKATEALVDLLDFDLGELFDNLIKERIALRGREVIPFLKKKVSEKPLCSELSIQERNEAIVELIKMVISGVRYTFGGGYSREDILKFYLFYVQMDLEKYYRKKGHYPKTLAQTSWTGPHLEFVEGKAGQKFKYEGYGHIYFLCTLGEDGKFGTKDDVKPPYHTEVFSFPENFKE